MENMIENSKKFLKSRRLAIPSLFLGELPKPHRHISGHVALPPEEGGDENKKRISSYLNNASFGFFPFNIPENIREDILDCLLFAQCRANAECEDKSDYLKWGLLYIEALEHMQWQKLGYEHTQVKINQNNSSINSEIVGGLGDLITEPVSSTLAAGLNLIQKLSETGAPSIKLFNLLVKDFSYGAFELSSIIGGKDHFEIVICAFKIPEKFRNRDFLGFRFNKELKQLDAFVYHANFSSTLYSGVKPVIKRKLQELKEKNRELLGRMRLS